MGLKLYYVVDGDWIEVSEDLSSPILTSHDGKRGDVQKVELILENDDNSKKYTNIIVKPNDTEYETTGWGVKLSNSTSLPTNAEWEDIEWGEEIRLADITGEDDVSFWYLVSCPPNTDAQNKTDIDIEISYTESLV